MKRSEYDKRNESQFRGRKVRTLVPLRNGSGEIPAGTVATIKRKWGGFGLSTEPCPCCGIRFYISKIPHHAVELLPADFDNYDVQPGGPALCLVKVDAEVLEAFPADLVKSIETVTKRPTLVVTKDFDVYLDTAAVEELKRFQYQVNDALEKGKA